MQFLSLDLGGALDKDPDAKHFPIIRIIAGNPLIMKQMVAETPHAGSYAPVTFIIWEEATKVFVAYDSIESALLPYHSNTALEVARDLDKKVLRLLEAVTN